MVYFCFFLFILTDIFHNGFIRLLKEIKFRDNLYNHNRKITFLILIYLVELDLISQNIIFHLYIRKKISFIVKKYLNYDYFLFINIINDKFLH